MKKLIFIALSLMLSACTHVPLTTMVKMRNFDVTKTDMNLIRVAIRIPQSMRIETGEVKMTFEFWMGAEARQKNTFVLEEYYAPVDVAQLAQYKKEGFKIAVFRVSEKDIAKVLLLFKKYEERKKQEKDNYHATFGVAAKGCREKETSEPVLMTTYFKSRETGEYLTLVNELDILQYAKDNNLPNEIPQLCSLKSK